MPAMEKRTQPYRILVAEEEPTIVRFLVCQLEAAGYETRNEKDGVFALKLLREEKIDLVVTNFFLPGMDGFELARQIRTDADLSAMPIVMMTARPPDLETAEFLSRSEPDAPVNSWLIKPFHPADLLRVVGGLLASNVKNMG